MCLLEGTRLLFERGEQQVGAWEALEATISACKRALNDLPPRCAAGINVVNLLFAEDLIGVSHGRMLAILSDLTHVRGYLRQLAAEGARIDRLRESVSQLGGSLGATRSPATSPKQPQDRRDAETAQNKSIMEARLRALEEENARMSRECADNLAELHRYYEEKVSELEQQVRELQKYGALGARNGAARVQELEQQLATLYAQDSAHEVRERYLSGLLEEARGRNATLGQYNADLERQIREFYQAIYAKLDRIDELDGQLREKHIEVYYLREERERALARSSVAQDAASHVSVGNTNLNAADDVGAQKASGAFLTGVEQPGSTKSSQNSSQLLRYNYQLNGALDSLLSRPQGVVAEKYADAVVLDDFDDLEVDYGEPQRPAAVLEDHNEHDNIFDEPTSRKKKKKLHKKVVTEQKPPEVDLADFDDFDDIYLDL